MILTLGLCLPNVKNFDKSQPLYAYNRPVCEEGRCAYRAELVNYAFSERIWEVFEGK